MTSEQAFWKALGVGTVITLTVWSVLLLVTRPQVENLVPFLFFALFTLVIVVPIVYKSYSREGERRREPKASHLRLIGGLFIAVGIVYTFDAVLKSRHPKGWDLAFTVVMAVFWCVSGIENLRRAARLSKTDQTSSV